MDTTNLIVMTSAKAKPEKEQEVHQALRDVARAARAQEGCIDYKIFLAEDGHTVNFEIWSSQEARDAFNSGPDVQKFAEAVSGNFAEPPQPVSYRELA